MSTVSAHNQELRERVEALRVVCCGMLRAIPCLLLALLLGVINPALCVLHCSLFHAHQAAPPQSLSHAHHDKQAETANQTHSIGPCGTAGLPQASSLTPRAAYELFPVALVLVALVVLLLTRPQTTPPGAHSAPPHSPLTPPPQALAFI